MFFERFGERFLVLKQSSPYLQILLSAGEQKKLSETEVLSVCNQMNLDRMMIKFVANGKSALASWEIDPQQTTLSVAFLDSMLGFMKKNIHDFLQRADEFSHAEKSYSEEDVKAMKLYLYLTSDYEERCQQDNLGDEMEVISESIRGYWKPRYLVDHRNHKAYEWMDKSCRLKTVTIEDIDFTSIITGRHRAENLDFTFPSFIRSFKSGVAEVRWQLNPDGQYYMDSDGYGMTDDEEYNIYGFIDRAGRVVVKFRHVGTRDELAGMRAKAESAVGR